MPALKTVQEYLRQASECEALAHRAVTDYERETLEKMAATWRILADTRKKAQAAKRNGDAEPPKPRR